MQECIIQYDFILYNTYFQEFYTINKSYRIFGNKNQYAIYKKMLPIFLYLNTYTNNVLWNTLDMGNLHKNLSGALATDDFLADP